MKALMVAVVAAALAAPAPAAELVVREAKGDVSVRHGVTETWAPVKSGDILKPDDTMRTGRGGSAVVASRQEAGRPDKSIRLPADVIVEMADVRDLSQEELMLKLTMERVRSSPYRWKGEDLNIPNATVVHGTQRGTDAAVGQDDPGTGALLLNGSRALLAGGFYSTCALRTMDVLRRYPALAADPENRMLVAEALERAELRSEALNEYVRIAAAGGLAPRQQDLVEAKIAGLRKSAGK
jgi:hypothetical protein